MADGLLGLLVEEVHALQIDGDLDVLLNGVLLIGGHSDDDLLVLHKEVHVGLGAQQLAEVDLGVEAVGVGAVLDGQEVLRTDAEDNLLADVGLEGLALGGGDLDLTRERRGILRRDTVS